MMNRAVAFAPWRAVKYEVGRDVPVHRGMAPVARTWLAARPALLLIRWLFLRALGVVYLFAFTSLAVQIRGLIGAGGILPAAAFLELVEANVGPARF